MDSTPLSAPELSIGTPAASSAPSQKELFLTWLRIGATSYGGGAVVQYLIQEHFIHKRHWLTAEEYARILGMCQITPGLTLIAITITIGKRLGGWSGMAISLAGLVLPSAAITVAMSAVYSGVRELPPVQAALRSLFAAIVGISLATSWRNVRPILAGTQKRGPGMLAVALAILAGSALVFLTFNPPVIWLYLLGGLCGAVVYAYAGRRSGEG